jgi:hypothetical protein
MRTPFETLHTALTAKRGVRLRREYSAEDCSPFRQNGQDGQGGDAFMPVILSHNVNYVNF